MSQTLEIIRSEHRRLAAIIRCFIGVMNDIKDQGLAADMDLFEQVVNYLESFLYQFHHPKEDEYLFHRLTDRVAESGEIVQRLIDEHAHGKELLARLRNNLDRYKKEPSHDHFMAFYNMAMVYRDFEWHHMITEEREVLPLAEKTLTEADWQELDAVFTAHDDPVFGNEPRESFNVLASRIVNQAPAPHGLG